MKKIIYLVLTLALCFSAYKIGDSRGYEAGFKTGYSYDCREEIKVLKGSLDDFKKSLEFSKAQVYRVMTEEDKRMRIYDSLVNIHGAKASAYNAKMDSLEKIDGVKRGRMLPTGIIRPVGFEE